MIRPDNREPNQNEVLLRDMLIAYILDHEVQEHQTRHCRTERCNIIAWLANALMLSPDDMVIMMSMLADYRKNTTPDQVRSAQQIEGEEWPDELEVKEK